MPKQQEMNTIQEFEIARTLNIQKTRPNLDQNNHILNYTFVWTLGGIRVCSDTGSSSGLK